jgi:AcrR family transcriptional regulator
MRERIVAAAVAVIRERGVTGATTKEIARAAGVAEGSLYNHFENKTALFGAAFGSATAGVRGASAELLGSVADGEVIDNLTKWAAAATRFWADVLPLTGSVLADSDLRAWLQQRSASPDQPTVTAMRYLEGEQQAGRVSPDTDTAVLAAALLGACQQHAYLSLVAGPAALTGTARLPDDADEYAARVVTTLMTGHLTGRSSGRGR